MTPNPKCAPDGDHCTRCNGVHNPQPGVTFVTSRTWGDDEQVDED
ncbi:hypothetical protein [Mycolicibacterium chlorophenolicum]|uniref:Uncharacterized protein n=1 Tax=Mycolicibacterium chlorophenolicum TaxID=37916 RepID=A0A0J6WI87_9MYCO|nr:hypothetical protein [Mycolicibacterium chlorophenolicum]KMO82299.1 hypothetical protein MCHLDSM_01451 [Mycolicibacterium chlorophenolicum]